MNTIPSCIVVEILKYLDIKDVVNYLITNSSPSEELLHSLCYIFKLPLCSSLYKFVRYANRDLDINIAKAIKKNNYDYLSRAIYPDYQYRNIKSIIPYISRDLLRILYTSMYPSIKQQIKDILEAKYVGVSDLDKDDIDILYELSCYIPETVTDFRSHIAECLMVSCSFSGDEMPYFPSSGDCDSHSSSSSCCDEASTLFINKIVNPKSVQFAYSYLSNNVKEFKNFYGSSYDEYEERTGIKLISKSISIELFDVVIERINCPTSLLELVRDIIEINRVDLYKHYLLCVLKDVVSEDLPGEIGNVARGITKELT